MMKKSCICLGALFFAFQVCFAQSFTVKGVRYRVLSKTERVAEVGNNQGCELEKVVIPHQVNFQGATYQVVAISDSAFVPANDNVGPREVVIPQGVLSIGKSAFEQCCDLTKVVLPEGLKVIGDQAFDGCEGLWDLPLPEGLERIGNYAFAQCHFSFLKTPSSLKRIGNYAFYNKGLNEVVLNEGLESIGEFAFSNNISLSSLTLPHSLRQIGCGAFAITGITTLIVPKEWKEIPERAFEDCPELRFLTIKEGVREIGTRAFSGCGKLRSLLLPASMKLVKNGAFEMMTLRSICLKNPNTTLEKGAIQVTCSQYTPNTSAKSDHPEVATVDKDGNLFVHSTGAANITVKTKNNETGQLSTAVCKVVVGGKSSGAATGGLRPTGVTGGKSSGAATGGLRPTGVTGGHDRRTSSDGSGLATTGALRATRG